MGAVVRSSVASPMGRFLRANTVHEAVIVPREGVGQDMGTSSLSSRLDPEVHTCGGGMAVNGGAILGGGLINIRAVNPYGVFARWPFSFEVPRFTARRGVSRAEKGIGQGKLNVILCINYLVRL